MKILLCNDDGLSSPGIAALRVLAKKVYPKAEIRVLAPDCQHSNCGHHVSILEKLTVLEHDNGFSCSGSPADCVRVAYFGWKWKPDLLLSGINEGANLGHDIPASGTVAAGRESVFHSVPAVALSQLLPSMEGVDSWNWELSVERGVSALNWAIEQGLEKQEGKRGLWCLNLPKSEAGDPEIVQTHAELDPAALDYLEVSSQTYQYTGDYFNRPGAVGSDVEATFGGKISACWVKV